MGKARDTSQLAGLIYAKPQISPVRIFSGIFFRRPTFVGEMYCGYRFPFAAYEMVFFMDISVYVVICEWFAFDGV